MWVDNVYQAFRYICHPLVAYVFQTDASGRRITFATDVCCSLRSRNRCTVILIPICLGKIEADQAKGILVVPAWATQAWYTRVLPMMGQRPLVWTPGSQLLVYPSANSTRREQIQLKLIAWSIFWVLYQK